MYTNIPCKRLQTVGVGFDLLVHSFMLYLFFLKAIKIGMLFKNILIKIAMMTQTNEFLEHKVFR